MDNKFDFFAGTMLFTSALLVLVYAVTLGRVLLYKTYRKIVVLILMLLVSNIFYIVVPIG